MSDQFRVPQARSTAGQGAAAEAAGGAARPAPWLRPVRTQSRDTAVLDALTEYVASAGIGRGERLPPERDLALRLGVSRSTIREALKRWQGLGIVEMRKGSGTYLRTAVEPGSVHLPLTIAARAGSLLLTLQVRRGLECEAAAVAARQATPDAIREIEKKLLAVEEMERRFGGSGQHDWEFHLAVYRATGNPLFEQIISQMHDAFHALFENPLRMPGFAARSFPLHREMFEAIRDRNPDLAWQKAKAIIDITEEDVREAMRAR